MSEINTPSLAAQVDFLLRRKFGHMVANTLKVGGRVTAKGDEPLKEAEEYEGELCAMPPEDLQALYEEEREKERIEWQIGSPARGGAEVFQSATGRSRLRALEQIRVLDA
jgi:hypothetical protein